MYGGRGESQDESREERKQAEIERGKREKKESQLKM